jgi:LacI family transcriptional regulator
MPTIKEVARKAGVSVGTVSNVINGSPAVRPALRERVLAAIRLLDYHPDHVARSLKTRQTRMLGMVIPDITNPFFPEVVKGAQTAALRHDYMLVTFNTDDRVDLESQVLSVLRERKTDGIVLVTAPSRGEVTHIRQTLAGGVPIVCLDRLPPGISVDCVSVDNAVGSRNCVSHLIAMGHRRIGIITGSLELQTARERLSGYKQALREARIPFDPALVRKGDFRSDTGYRVSVEWLTHAGAPRPTALFVSNGMMALGVLRALEELHLRCPEDMALAAFDDLVQAAVFRPHLTAVAQPAYEMGYQGTELLIKRVSGAMRDPKPVAIRLATQLRVRESTLGARPAPDDAALAASVP